MRNSGAISLVVWVLICFGAAGLGSIGSTNSPEFYRQLNRPEWAPPAWLFGPVWSALYLLMAVAAWLVWRVVPASPEESRARQRGLVMYVAQLALNALWTWLFFAWRQGAAAFAEIVVLWVAIVVTIWCFGRVRPLAAWLLVPYLGWVSFATALTWAMWHRNPGQL